MKKLILPIAIALLATTASAGERNEREGQELNRTLKNMHLALAVKMSEVRMKGYTCETDSYSADVIEQLSKYSLEAKKIQAALKKNPVLMKDLGNNFSLRKLSQGYISAKPMELPTLLKVLAGSTFYSEAGGAYGASEKFEFKANGVVIVSTIEFKEDGMPTWVPAQARYSVERTSTGPQIKVDRGAKGSVTYEFRNETRIGEDSLTPVGGTLYNGMTTSNWECEA